MDDEFERQSGKLMALKDKGAFKGNIKAFKDQMKTISEEATLRSRQRLGVPPAESESGMKTPEQTTTSNSEEQTTTKEDDNSEEQTTTSSRTSPRLKKSVAPVERVLLLPRPPLPFRCSRRPARPSAASRSSCLTAFFADRAEGTP